MNLKEPKWRKGYQDEKTVNLELRDGRTKTRGLRHPKDVEKWMKMESSTEETKMKNQNN